MLTKEKTGLVVVDVQGKLARIVHDSAAVIANCATLIAGARALDLPIIVLEQNPERLGPTVPELREVLGEAEPIGKFTFSGCGTPEFLQAVKATDVETWLVCGIEAHICVYQTAKGLAEQGYKVELVSDCISSRTQANIQLGINRLERCGVGITGLEMCLYELVQDCRAPQFKQVLKLIR